MKHLAAHACRHALAMLWQVPTWRWASLIITLVLAVAMRLLPRHPLLEADEDTLLVVRGFWPLHILGLVMILPGTTALQRDRLPITRTLQRLALFQARALSILVLFAVWVGLAALPAPDPLGSALPPGFIGPLLLRGLCAVCFLLALFQLLEGALGSRAARALGILLWLMLPALARLAHAEVPVISVLTPDLSFLLAPLEDGRLFWSRTVAYAMTYSAAGLALDVTWMSRRD